MICTTVLALLLSILLYTHVADKNHLAAELRRMALWIRVLSVMIGLLAWVMAMMVGAAHTLLAVFLILMGAKIGVYVLTLKTPKDLGEFSSNGSA